jgi:tRNA dimethylallyltransferase
VARRTDEMLERGLLDEVRGLLGRYPRELRPLEAIGYRQAVAVVRGECGLEAARHDIVAETMRYAKRQMTWFRHQVQAVWRETPGAASEAAREWLTSMDAR